jgi:hypothetical protein
MRSPASTVFTAKAAIAAIARIGSQVETPSAGSSVKW